MPMAAKCGCTRPVTALDLFGPEVPLELLVDKYAFTMGNALFEAGRINNRSVFELAFRRHQPLQVIDGVQTRAGYSLAGGMDYSLEWFRRLRFRTSALDTLAMERGENGDPLLCDGYLRWLEALQPEADIFTVNEGEVVFPYQPLVRSFGREGENILFEGGFLNFNNGQSGTMSRARRIVTAANGKDVGDNSLRRGLSVEGSVAAAHAAYKAGFAATSNMLAVHLLKIRSQGTMAHAFILFFDTQRQAFVAFAKGSRGAVVTLMDTYNTQTAIEDAIYVAQMLREMGRELYALRLDSGDLVKLSKVMKRRLRDAGFPDVKVAASNSLNEFTITAMEAQGAEIDTYNCGDAVASAPLFGAVWKPTVVEYEDGSFGDVVKLSEDGVKSSFPGSHQTRRFFDDDGMFAGDLTFELDAPFPDDRTIHLPNRDEVKEIPAHFRGEDCLIQRVRKGDLIQHVSCHHATRDYVAERVAALPAEVQRLTFADEYPAGFSGDVIEKRRKIIAHTRKHSRAYRPLIEVGI